MRLPVYAAPTLLVQRQQRPVAATGVTAGISNGALTIDSPASFVGTFQLTLTTTDGSLTTSESFQVQSTETPPVPAAIASQTVSASGNPVVLDLSSTGTAGDAVTYSATAVSAPYALQQQYNFTGLGLFSTTANGVKTTAYVLHSNVAGGSGKYVPVDEHRCHLRLRRLGELCKHDRR